MTIKKFLNVAGFVKKHLRNASRKWPGKNEAERNARVARGLYKCAGCQKLVKRQEYQMDHIHPVVPVTGFTTWDDYINRLFCGPEGFQLLCSVCHDTKTLQENMARDIIKGKKPKIKRKTKKRKRK